MLNGLLSFFFALLCILLILIILIQKGKGSIGISGINSSNQMLFGGSGGQTLFQKATWIMAAILIFGSVSLSSLKYKKYRDRNISYTIPSNTQN